MKARWFGGTHVRWMPIPLTVQAWLVWVSYFASLAWALTRSPVQPWLVVSLTLLLITVIVGTTGPET